MHIINKLFKKIAALIVEHYIWVLILVIPTLLVAIWFRNGNIMATGESGISFYNFDLQYHIIKSAWADYTLGYPTNISVAGAPTYYFLSIFQKVGVPAYVLQAAFFWVILTVSGFSIYFLTKQFFPDIPKKYLILAVFFYWFNPFTMVNVWNRFLNNFIVFYALLPLSLLIFIRGIHTKKYTYALLLGLVSVIFSYALTSIVFNMVFWLVLLYTTLFYFYFNKGENRIFTIKFFIVSLIFWGIVNFWWIGQTFSYISLGSFSAVATTSFKIESNYHTFFLISQRLGNLVDLFRLKHATFFSDMYQFPFVVLLEFIVIGIILYPIIVKKKLKETLFLANLFIISIFFAKGNNMPLGEIFDKAFINLSFLQVFRNPFEKIGFIFPVAAAPLLCLGAALLIEKSNPLQKKFIYSFIFFWLVVVWGGPFWTRHVFTSNEVPTDQVDVGFSVSVPKYYKEASDWLFSQGDNFRLIVFPIGDEGITYIWPKGYSGVELSNQLLPITSVSFNTNIPFYNEISKSLEEIFSTRENFSKTMNLLNAKYIVLRSDIDWKVRGMRNPQVIQNTLQELESRGEFKKAAQFGNLQFWENLYWKDHTIYSANELIKVSGGSTVEDILNVENSKDLVIYPGNNNLKENKLIRSEIIKPVSKFGLGNKRPTEVNITDDYMFPAVRFLPSHILYPAILFKERIEKASIKDQNSLLLKKLSLAGKRLNEIMMEAEKGGIRGSFIAINLYKQQLMELLPELSSGVSKVDGEYFLFQENVYEIFSKHLNKLKAIRSVLPEGEKKEIFSMEETLQKQLVDLNIFPVFGYLERQDFLIDGRVIYQFKVEEEGSYELLLDSKNWNKYFKSSFEEPFVFQVDEEIISRKAELVNEKFVSYGFFNFAAGKHEIAWNTPDEINLIDVPVDLSMNVDHGVIRKAFPINNFDPYTEYILSLDYLIKKGSGVEVIFEQDNDKSKKGILEPRFNKYLGSDLYDFELKNYTAIVIPSDTADSAKLIFQIRPWNNCEDIFRTRGVEKCLDQEFRRPYDKTTDVTVQNASFVRASTEIPILRKKSSNSSNPVPKISYQKINASEYKVKIEQATKPFILILSELFDPGWKIFNGGKELEGEHFLANAYANGWIIDRSGNLEIVVKFIPQDILNRGEKISQVAFIGAITFIGWKFWRGNGK